MSARQASKRLSRAAATRFWLCALLALVCVFGLERSSAYAAPSKAPTDYIQPSLKGDGFSKSALGYASALKFLRNAGYDPITMRDPREREFAADDVILMLDPNLHHRLSAPQIDALRSYVSSDATIIVSLPKRYGAQQSLAGQELLKTGLLSVGASAGVLRILDGHADVQRDVTPHAEGPWNLRVEAEDLQSFHHVGDNTEVYVGDEHAAIVIASKRQNGAPIFFVSDSDLFANHGLGRGDHALILERLVSQGLGSGGDVYVDEAFHGYLQTYDPLQTALRAPGILLSVSATIFAFLLLWFYLGSPRRSPQEAPMVRYTEHELAQRTGRILGAYQTPKVRLERYRDLLVRNVLSPSSAQDAATYLARIEQLEALRGARTSLRTLDQNLHALSAGASRRQVRQLLRQYQQWFAEVSDATR